MGDFNDQKQKSSESSKTILFFSLSLYGHPQQKVAKS